MTKPRDRSGTRLRILSAAEALIARRGALGVGVNALAAEAGVDKVLVYRYFGGMAGVMSALAGERRLWSEPSIEGSATLADAARVTLLTAARELLERPIARQALAASVSGENELTTQLDEARAAGHRRLLEQLRQEFRAPPYVDVPALLALIEAGLTHLALMRERGASTYEIDLEEGWTRIEKAATVILRALLEPADS